MGWFAPQNGWAIGFTSAVAVLIIACPCTLGLSTPMSVTAATGRAATRGILFRDAPAIGDAGPRAALGFTGQ